MDHAQQAISKAHWRLVPFVCLLYLISYIDRTNIAFAALSMNKSLGLSATQYGLAAGLFFLGYIVVEIPSNLIQTKVGTRLWIPRIMITWGIMTMGMALVTGVDSLCVARILLGAAEGGFFPGIVYYLTLWFPRAYRGRVIGQLMFATSLSGIIGGPTASLIFAQLEGTWGLAAWQWLFVIEGFPAVILGFTCWWLLPDRPATAKWLSNDEKHALEVMLAREDADTHADRPYGLLWAMTNPRVLLLAFLMFCAQGTGYGLGFWMPQIIKGLGLSNVAVGLVSVLPYAIGGTSLLIWTRFADTRPDRAVPLAITMSVAALGYASIGLADGSTGWTMAALALTVLGTGSITALLWSIPTTFIAGVPAAGAFAVISSIGASSGFFGPYLVGLSKDLTGGFSASMYVISVTVALAAALVFGFCRNLSARPRVVAAQ